MKTWLKPVSLALFLLVYEVQASQPKWQEGVIIQKVGSDFVFVFPSMSKGVITAVAKPTGRIRIGKTIEIVYSIKIMKGSSNARFIALDATPLSQHKLHSFTPELQVANNDSAALGFYVKDTSQSRLNMHINSQFTHEIGQKNVQEKIGREGNLNVVIGKGERVRFRIVKVEIN